MIYFDKVKMSRGYVSKPLDFNRKMVIAAVRSNKKNAIHCVCEINVERPLSYRSEIKDSDGNKVSFTAYLVKCLANVLLEFPDMNSFIRRNKLIILDEITISVLIERQIDGSSTPEPLAIHAAQEKSVWQITNEIRQAMKNGRSIGGLSGSTLVRFIPGFLLRTFVRIADQNITMAKKYGKVAITSVGMFSKNASWFIPHGTATVLLTVGGIYDKKELGETGNLMKQKYLKLTASFDHEIIDGAPAARFMNRLESEIASGNTLLEN